MTKSPIVQSSSKQVKGYALGNEVTNSPIYPLTHSFTQLLVQQKSEDLEDDEELIF